RPAHRPVALQLGYDLTPYAHAVFREWSAPNNRPGARFAPGLCTPWATRLRVLPAGRPAVVPACAARCARAAPSRAGAAPVHALSIAAFRSFSVRWGRS